MCGILLPDRKIVRALHAILRDVYVTRTQAIRNIQLVEHARFIAVALVCPACHCCLRPKEGGANLRVSHLICFHLSPDVARAPTWEHNQRRICQKLDKS